MMMMIMMMTTMMMKRGDNTEHSCVFWEGFEKMNWGKGGGVPPGWKWWHFFTSPHCVFSNVFQNCLHTRIHSLIGCILFVLLFSSVCFHMSPEMACTRRCKVTLIALIQSHNFQERVQLPMCVVLCCVKFMIVNVVLGLRYYFTHHDLVPVLLRVK